MGVCEEIGVTQLAELLGKEVAYIEKVKELIMQYPAEDNSELAKRLVERTEKIESCV